MALLSVPASVIPFFEAHMKNIFWITSLFFTLSACVTEYYPEGFFPGTELIKVKTSSASALRWVKSFRDKEVILILSNQTIELVGSEINSSFFAVGNTKFWRLSFRVGEHGNIDPATHLSDNVNRYIASPGLPGAGPWNWLVYSYDSNGNLIRSSLVHQF